MDIPQPPTPDPFHGIGGSYTVDPATGVRTRVEGPPMETDTEQPTTAADPAEGDAT